MLKWHCLFSCALAWRGKNTSKDKKHNFNFVHLGSKHDFCDFGKMLILKKIKISRLLDLFIHQVYWTKKKPTKPWGKKNPKCNFIFFMMRPISAEFKNWRERTVKWQKAQGHTKKRIKMLFLPTCFLMMNATDNFFPVIRTRYKKNFGDTHVAGKIFMVMHMIQKKNSDSH